MADIEVRFRVIDYKRFGQAFVYAARAYYKFRFNPQRPLSYFFDALKYYYESDEVLKDIKISLSVSIITLLEAPMYVSIKFRIPLENRKKIIMIKGGDLKYPTITPLTPSNLYFVPQRSPLETMILAIGSGLPGPMFPFPPLGKMLTFDFNDNTIGALNDVVFVDPTFSLPVPSDLTIINRIAVDPEFLRDNILETEFIALVLGVPLICRANLVEFLLENLPHDILYHCEYYLRQISIANASSTWRRFLHREIQIDELLSTPNLGSYLNVNTMLRALERTDKVLPKLNVNIFNMDIVLEHLKRLQVSPQVVYDHIIQKGRKFYFNFISESLMTFLGEELANELQLKLGQETINYQNDLPKILPGEPVEEISLDDVDISNMELLGQGSYGKVYGSDDSQFVYKSFLSQRGFDGELASLNYMNRYLADASNISRVVCYDSRNQLFKCMRLSPLPKQVNPFIEFNGQRSIFLQLAQGLNSLHSSGLVHVDIKPDNIMVTADSRIEFIDFGFLRTTCKKPQENFQGTYAFFPPEYFAGVMRYRDLLNQNPEKVMQAHDVWSTILTIYELALGHQYYRYMRAIGYRQPMEDLIFTFIVLASRENPFELPIYTSKTATNKTKVATENVRFFTPPEFKSLQKFTDNREIKALITQCLKHNPLERASALDILQLINYIPSSISPCSRADLIDCAPFPHKRDNRERANWVSLCYFFDVNPLRYIIHFESMDNELTYIDYFAILQACLKLDHIVRPLGYAYVDLPYPVPLSVINDRIVTYYDCMKLATYYVNALKDLPFWLIPVKFFSKVDNDFYFTLESAYIRGDMQYKSGTEALNL